MRSLVISNHVCGDETGCFEGDLGTFPAVFMASKIGVLRQIMMFSQRRSTVFVPEAISLQNSIATFP